MAALPQNIPNSMNILYSYLKELGKGNTYKYLTHKNLLTMSDKMNSLASDYHKGNVSLCNRGNYSLSDNIAHNVFFKVCYLRYPFIFFIQQLFLKYLLCAWTIFVVYRKGLIA